MMAKLCGQAEGSAHHLPLSPLPLPPPRSPAARSHINKLPARRADRPGAMGSSFYIISLIFYQREGSEPVLGGLEGSAEIEGGRGVGGKVWAETLMARNNSKKKPGPLVAAPPIVSTSASPPPSLTDSHEEVPYRRGWSLQASYFPGHGLPAA